MSVDIRRILDAMAGLARAIPGAPHPSVSLHNCNDSLMRALRGIAYSYERYENGSGTQEWDCASVRVEGASLYAYSQHRPVAVETETDADAVEAALAQAEAAVRP